MSTSDTIYYGEQYCQAIKSNHQKCTNKAYFCVKEQYLCGIHSKKFTQRQKLPMNPNKKSIAESELTTHSQTIETVARNNHSSQQKGNVICYHMTMFKKVQLTEGYINIFPNFKHGSRRDGLGMPSLSPMSLGPINHKQPGIPPAKNLENMHQSNKVFQNEIGIDGKPNEQFYQTRLNMYLDSIPHRHKESSGHKNVPLYSVWVNKNGEEIHLSYIESRQIYCHYYEQMVSILPDFLKLKQMIDNGYNLQICGYDAYQPIKPIDEHYLDSSKPFGHELVLYTMLTSEKNDYPWRRHQFIDFNET